MKKYILIITISILSFANALFAQNPVEVKSMDMNEYASWAGLFVIFMIFSMFALFLIYSSKEEVPAITIPVPKIAIKSNFANSTATIAIPLVSIDMKVIRLTLIFSLVISVLILILIIIK